jgi:hypothetical protein
VEVAVVELSLQVPFSSLEAEAVASANSSETNAVAQVEAEAVALALLSAWVRLIAPVTELICRRYHRPFIQK